MFDSEEKAEVFMKRLDKYIDAKIRVNVTPSAHGHNAYPFEREEVKFQREALKKFLFEAE